MNINVPVSELTLPVIEFLLFIGGKLLQSKELHSRTLSSFKFNQAEMEVMHLVTPFCALLMLFRISPMQNCCRSSKF